MACRAAPSSELPAGEHGDIAERSPRREEILLQFSLLSLEVLFPSPLLILTSPQWLTAIHVISDHLKHAGCFAEEQKLYYPLTICPVTFIEELGYHILTHSHALLIAGGVRKTSAVTQPPEVAALAFCL